MFLGFWLLGNVHMPSFISSDLGLGFGLRTEILETEILFFLPRWVLCPYLPLSLTIAIAIEQRKSLLLHFFFFFK